MKIIKKMFAASKKSVRKRFVKPVNSEVNFEKWTAFKNEEDYLKGYFDFPLFDVRYESSGKRIRSFFLLGIVEGIVSSGAAGDMAECGCYKGHSSYAIAKILQKNNFKNNFFIFDSFEGLSSPTPEDLLSDDGSSIRQDLKAALEGNSLKFIADMSDYVGIMSEFNFVDIKKGWIPERFSEVSNRKFSLIHIDVDVYQPTFDSLNFFYERLLPGGVIFIDDFSRPYWPGCDRAVREFIDSLSADDDYRFFKVPLGGAVLIKVF